MKSQVICDALNAVNPTPAQRARMRAALEAQLPAEKPHRRGAHQQKASSQRWWTIIPAAAALFAVVLLGIFVIGYLALSDVVEPWLTGLLKDMTQMRKTAYLKILGLDVVGAGALLYWIVGMGSEAGNNLLIPVLVYFLANQMKRKLRPEFEGITEKILKDQAEASDEEETDPEELSDKEK